jgi:2-methylcitrate dehydratase PrpD
MLVLDLVGNIIRARHDVDSTPILLAAVRSLGLGAGNSGVFGDPSRWTPAGAALLNGALGHSLDFDDTHAAASLHPGTVVIPAALAAGEMAGSSGAEVLAGIVAGYEVACRLACALPARAHYDRGFHPTATCGTFGAAAAAGRVLGLDAVGIASAFGIALSQAAGSMQFLVNGAWTKRFQVGWAAMGGLAAATLASEGFRGATEAFEGRHGFLRAYAPDPLPEQALAELGQRFAVMETAVKPYPSCRYGHAGIDAALALRAEHKLRPEEIESVRYDLSAAGMLLVGEPAERKAEPPGVVDAQFSGPYVIACALATGRVAWDSYRKLRDPAIRAMMVKVT